MLRARGARKGVQIYDFADKALDQPGGVQIGTELFGGATRLLITADAGGADAAWLMGATTRGDYHV